MYSLYLICDDRLLSESGSTSASSSSNAIASSSASASESEIVSASTSTPTTTSASQSRSASASDTLHDAMICLSCKDPIVMHKLDEIGPVNNRPTSERLNHFVQKRRKKRNKRENMTPPQIAQQTHSKCRIHAQKSRKT